MPRKEFNEELLLTWAIRQRLDFEGAYDQDVGALVNDTARTLILPFNPGSWWAAIQRTSGAVHRFESNMLVLPTVEQQVFLMELLRRLNREIHHDGRWIVAWTHGNQRWIAMWVDPHGDIAFTMDNEDRWEEVIKQPMLYWVGDCEGSWTAWHHSMVTVLNPAPEAEYKRAQGQRPPSTLH